MRLLIKPSILKGAVDIPPSKSHTIRAIVIASLANGTSEIENPLVSSDTLSAGGVCRAFGAGLEEKGNIWVVNGVAALPSVPENVLDVGNSGTTLRLGLGVAALCDGYTVFTGDHQIRKRPVQQLIDAYRHLGAEGFTTRGNGCAPVVIRGKIRGGRTEIRAVTSQFLSSLLISTPLAEGNTEIRVIELNEVPYVEMTLAWLDFLNITYERKDFKRFYIKGGQNYRAFKRRVPGDFSSATFFMCAAAVTGSEIFLRGLDMSDVQGDRAVAGMLQEMGADVSCPADGIRLKGGDLKGVELDLNSTPDALPALAVTACFATGETRLRNVPQARLKETDRIAVMAGELKKMGGDVEELADGLVIRGRRLTGCEVDGHHDHRIVMALAVAGLASKGVTAVDTAEAVNVTFPDFIKLMKALGADIEILR